MAPASGSPSVSQQHPGMPGSSGSSHCTEPMQCQPGLASEASSSQQVSPVPTRLGRAPSWQHRGLPDCSHHLPQVAYKPLDLRSPPFPWRLHHGPSPAAPSSVRESRQAPGHLGIGHQGTRAPRYQGMGTRTSGHRASGHRTPGHQGTKAQGTRPRGTRCSLYSWDGSASVGWQESPARHVQGFPVNGSSPGTRSPSTKATEHTGLQPDCTAPHSATSPPCSTDTAADLHLGTARSPCPALSHTCRTRDATPRGQGLQPVASGYPRRGGTAQEVSH